MTPSAFVGGTELGTLYRRTFPLQWWDFFNARNCIVSFAAYQNVMVRNAAKWAPCKMSVTFGFAVRDTWCFDVLWLFAFAAPVYSPLLLLNKLHPCFPAYGGARQLLSHRLLWSSSIFLKRYDKNLAITYGLPGSNVQSFVISFFFLFGSRIKGQVLCQIKHG